jgi:hypothetical protein
MFHCPGKEFCYCNIVQILQLFDLRQWVCNLAQISNINASVVQCFRKCCPIHWSSRMIQTISHLSQKSKQFPFCNFVSCPSVLFRSIYRRASYWMTALAVQNYVWKLSATRFNIMPSSHNSSTLTIQNHLTIPCHCYVNPAAGIIASPTTMCLIQIQTFFPWCWIPKPHKQQGPDNFLNLTHRRDNLKYVTLSLSWQTSLVSDFLFYSGTGGPQLLDIWLSYIINSQP